MKYIKRPVVVEAIQWDGTNLDEIKAFAGENIKKLPEFSALKVFTLEGPMIASHGDYIIKGIKGEFYPCKPDVFRATYDDYYSEEDEACDDEDCEGVDFGTALMLMKTGEKMCREGWNGEDMFVYYVPEGRYVPCTEAGKSLCGEDGRVFYFPYIAMKTVSGGVVPWLASQTDMLAEDWCIYLTEDEAKERGIV